MRWSAPRTASLAAVICRAVGGSSWRCAPGQAKRADVDRPDPGSTEQRRPDDELGRSAADVDDRDDLRQCLAGTGDGAVVGEASFAVGGEHANRQAGRLGEGVASAPPPSLPWRPGAVTITIERSTPSSSAVFTYAPQTSAHIAIVPSQRVPVRSISAPSRR